LERLLQLYIGVHSTKEVTTVSVERSYLRSASVAADNPLSMYLKEINRIPLLTREKEVELAREARKGSCEAKSRLVEANLRFVVTVARKYQNQGLPLIDLISEGNLGLCAAVDRFDVEKGYHFISYAVWWIRQSILRALCEKTRMIRLPFNRANELMKIEKARRELSRHRESEPDAEEIADYLKLDRDRVRRLLNISQETLFLEKPLSPEKDSGTLTDTLEDTRGGNPEQVAMNALLQELIEEVLDTLHGREAEVIKLRFGLDGRKALSLREIADRLNLTKERIRQIEKCALKRLRNPVRTRKLESYVLG
jgi:RNA polymerase primary sigma factor